MLGLLYNNRGAVECVDRFCQCMEGQVKGKEWTWGEPGFDYQLESQVN